VGLESQLIDADHILLKVLCPHPQPHLNQLLLAVAGLTKKKKKKKKKKKLGCGFIKVLCRGLRWIVS
jgi:hypothetical protein